MLLEFVRSVAGVGKVFPVTASDPMPTSQLALPTVARQLDVSGVSASVVLTAACRRVSVYARGGAMRYVVGEGAQTASATTSHYIAAEERLDFAVPAGATIAAIRGASDSAGVAL